MPAQGQLIAVDFSQCIAYRHDPAVPGGLKAEYIPSAEVRVTFAMSYQEYSEFLSTREKGQFNILSEKEA